MLILAVYFAHFHAAYEQVIQKLGDLYNSGILTHILRILLSTQRMIYCAAGKILMADTPRRIKFMGYDKVKDQTTLPSCWHPLSRGC